LGLAIAPDNPATTGGPVSLRAVALAAVGGALIATSMGSCVLIGVAEPQVPPLLIQVALGSFIVGGLCLALAIFRFRNRGGPNAWPGVAQSTILLLTGLVCTPGSLAGAYLLYPSEVGVVLLAFFVVGFAFTIGAAILLTRAIYTDSTR
jgi:hypothetical protein